MKNNVYPYKPQFYYIKEGFKGVKIIWYVFVMNTEDANEPIGYKFVRYQMLASRKCCKIKTARNDSPCASCVDTLSNRQ